MTVHAEAGPHLDRTLEAIRALGKRAGVAINPGTHESAIEHASEIEWVAEFCEFPKGAPTRARVGVGSLRLQSRGTDRARLLEGCLYFDC